MTELVIVRGLPGCGKTTYARAWVAEDRKNRARVNRDDLRRMVDDGEYEKGVTEGRILVARDNAITGLLRRGVSVISDDTNLPNRTVRDLMRIGRNAKVNVSIHDMTDVDFNVAKSQNAHRKDKEPIPQYVIDDMYRRYIKGKPYPLPWEETKYGNVEYIPYSGTPGKPPAIIVDIDGTVALKGERSPYDESRVSEDLPNVPIVNLVQTFFDNAVWYGWDLVFCSGRSDACRSATEDWIDSHILTGQRGYKLLMRKAGDTRKDSIVKYELFNEYIRDNYDVQFVLDDRNQVVEMWRAIGLTCLQVAPGDF